ncbi:MAG: hypothetical protein RL689_35 [Planctomycetota bacterium]|jgi:hypothetical protein
MLRSGCKGWGVRSVLGLVGAGLTAAGATPASAQVPGVSVDQFMQTGMPLDAARSGRLFSRPVSDGVAPFWSTLWWNPSLSVATDGLTHVDPATGAELATAGGRVTPWAAFPGGYASGSNFQPHWPVSVPLGTTVWGSALVRGTSCDVARLGLLVCDEFTYCSSDEAALWIGKVGCNLWTVRQMAAGIEEPLPLPPGDLALLLYRVESTASGVGTVSVWMNPPLEGELPPPSAVVNGWSMGRGMYATALVAEGYHEPSIDEVRMGPTAASVLPLKSFRWTAAEGGDGRRYEVVTSTSPLTWTQARDAAVMRGGRLAELSGPEQASVVSRNVLAREDVWTQGFSEFGTADFRGPWIGARRQDAHTHDHASGWEWLGGAPWSFADWSPSAGSTNFMAGYDHAVLVGEWQGWMVGDGSPKWMPTPDSGYGRVQSYVVEYPPAPVGPVVPDAVITDTFPYSLTLAATLPPGSTGLQWLRGGVPLVDGVHANFVISGATTNQLTIYGINFEGLGEYEIQGFDVAGMPFSHRGRIRIDATQQPFASCSYDMPFYRVFVAPSGAVSFEEARQHAASLGGRLASASWQQHQQAIDAMTCHEALHTVDSTLGVVGPWIGGRKADGDQWRWSNGVPIAGGGVSNWVSGGPRSYWPWDIAASIYMTPEAPGSASMRWADMFDGEQSFGTLPNSYVVEWPTPFRESAGTSMVEVDCGGEIVLEVTPADHGVVGSYAWYGPGGMLQDGTTPNGTVVSGASSTRLVLSSLAQGDAGVHVPVLVTQNGCGFLSGLNFQVVVNCDNPCPADFNQDGGVDGGDIDALFAAWEAGDSAADVNADGGVDFGDVDTFFAAWEAGGC